MTPYDLAKAINAHLKPQPIAVLNAEEVDENFHARFAAKNKLYCYRIINRTAPLTIEQGMAWWFKKPLDAAAMHDAAQLLLGHHDFTTFRDSECQAKSPMKSLDRFDVTRSGEEIRFEVEGRSFLHHQVRNMVGTLTLIGEGKWTKSDLKAALAAKDRGRIPSPAAC